MTTTGRLPQRAHSAYRVLNEKNFKQRAKLLESIDEQGFALILYWNQIEIALKLMQYAYSVKDGWPITLDFLRTTWKPLQSLKTVDLKKYELVLSSAAHSLWKTRNKIAHEGHNVPIDKYREYLEAALWVIDELQKQIPPLERLREKKRRSDAQLQK